MNEHINPVDPESADFQAAETTLGSTPEEKEKRLTVEAYLAEELPYKGWRAEKMALYTTDKEIAALKAHQDPKDLELTSVALENPLRLTYEEYSQEWNSNNLGNDGLSSKIRKELANGHDGLVVEADPEYAPARAAGRWPANHDYTFAQEIYFKFSDSGKN